ncbi:hypothetical protein GCM10010232_38060 [Streptomyces amakusaensis]|uniref:Uncharacterized protein n=1 Tax=Streptomyces amakusaensis TaxID=67271 RepID=A0ABW0AU76_9ACTN
MTHHDIPLSPGLPGIAGMELQAASGHLADEPAIFILQPHTLQVRDAQDRVEIPDSLEFLVRRAGGRQLTTTSLSAPQHTPGWSAELRLPDEALVIRFPDTSHLYDGSLPSGRTWQRAVGDSGDVVIVTGPLADVDCIDPAIQAGLTTYLRVPLSIER